MNPKGPVNQNERSVWGDVKKVVVLVVRTTKSESPPLLGSITTTIFCWGDFLFGIFCLESPGREKLLISSKIEKFSFNSAKTFECLFTKSA